MKFQESTHLAGEEIGNLGLSGLRLALALCYANFAVYLFLYITGMYINIFITSGINTVGIDDPINIVHMVAATLNFAFSFIILVISLMSGMRKAALFSIGALVSLVIGTIGGLVFLSSGGSRASSDLTLEGGWIMSFLFMLALFLSYYATLKVMRAVRVIEAVSPR